MVRRVSLLASPCLAVEQTGLLQATVGVHSHITELSNKVGQMQNMAKSWELKAKSETQVDEGSLTEVFNVMGRQLTECNDMKVNLANFLTEQHHNIVESVNERWIAQLPSLRARGWDPVCTRSGEHNECRQHEVTGKVAKDKQCAERDVVVSHCKAQNPLCACAGGSRDAATVLSCLESAAQWHDNLNDEDYYNSPVEKQCFNVSVVTQSWGSENSWSISGPGGTCRNSTQYSNDLEETEQCCLPGGDYTLTCQDDLGDAWHGGNLSFLNETHCVDFNLDDVSWDDMTLGRPGKTSVVHLPDLIDRRGHVDDVAPGYGLSVSSTFHADVVKEAQDCTDAEVASADLMSVCHDKQMLWQSAFCEFGLFANMMCGQFDNEFDGALTTYEDLIAGQDFEMIENKNVCYASLKVQCWVNVIRSNLGMSTLPMAVTPQPDFTIDGCQSYSFEPHCTDTLSVHVEDHAATPRWECRDSPLVQISVKDGQPNSPQWVQHYYETNNPAECQFNVPFINPRQDLETCEPSF